MASTGINNQHKQSRVDGAERAEGARGDLDFEEDACLLSSSQLWVLILMMAGSSYAIPL